MSDKMVSCTSTEHGIELAFIGKSSKIPMKMFRLSWDEVIDLIDERGEVISNEEVVRLIDKATDE